MAEIKMDLSEYEVLIENKNLYKQGLEREKELNNKLDLLNKEKIKILEESKMKVVKTIKKEILETTSVMVSSVEFIRNVKLFLSRFPYGVSDDRFKQFLQQLFVTKKFPSITESEETYIVGLDEVKKDIREELEKNLSRNVREKLSFIDDFIEQKESLIKEKENLFSENSDLKKEIERLNLTIVNLNTTIKIEKEKNFNLWKIKHVLKNKKTWFISIPKAIEISKLLNLN